MCLGDACAYLGLRGAESGERTSARAWAGNCLARAGFLPENATRRESAMAFIPATYLAPATVTQSAARARLRAAGCRPINHATSTRILVSVSPLICKSQPCRRCSSLFKCTNGRLSSQGATTPDRLHLRSIPTESLLFSHVIHVIHVIHPTYLLSLKVRTAARAPST
jgi:hypothetical protein